MEPVDAEGRRPVTLTGLEPELERALDLAGVLVFALSGASLAARRHFDLVGILVLATVTGLGGGILRDTLLGQLPPVALRDQLYLAVPLVATAFVLVAHHLVERMHRPVLAFDAAGLGLFCVVGSAKALDAGLGVLPSVLLGTMTAVGGGVIRDVLAREVPTVFKADSALYAIPATLGAAATAAVWSQDALDAPQAGAIAAAVLVVRLLAIRRGWRAPTAKRRG
ncbi:MAG TPA: hypothetical protein DCS55_07270 [Acidimicrobiaceae bacterium]|nr:hypothetical protein [Acidimicrobiaceae bacterium]